MTQMVQQMQIHVSAGYTASGMAFTLTASEATAGTSTKLAVAYALNDTVSLTGKTDQVSWLRISSNNWCINNT